MTKFWKKYKDILQPQLTVSPKDPVVFTQKSENPVLAKYYSTVNEELGNANIFKEAEDDLSSPFESTILLQKTGKWMEK